MTIIKRAYIKKLPDGRWRVMSESGRNMGTYYSKSMAEKRLAQVEMFKHIKGRKNRKKRKKSYNLYIDTIKKAEIYETVNSYSFIMRDLNKNYPEKVDAFMETYKRAFEEALLNKENDPELHALLQAVLAVGYLKKAAKIDKIAQTAVEMGNPQLAGRVVANVINFLMQKVPKNQRFQSLNTLRNTLLNLSVGEISSKKSPPSSALGQSVALVKNMLGGHNPDYVRQVIQEAIRYLY